MGMHAHLYLGPYVECTAKPEMKGKIVQGCTDRKCSEYPTEDGCDAEGKFCSECGSPIGPVGVKVVDYPDPYDIVEDALFEIQTETPMEEGGPVFLAPNQRRDGDPRPASLNNQEEFSLDLRNVDWKKEVAWFEKAFHGELCALREVYAKVEIKWGLHKYIC